MTLRLTVERERWRTHVDSFVRRVERLIPVAKGNGYGFGLVPLVAEAAKLAVVVAVGTPHEAAAAAPAAGSARLLVLTPATAASAGTLSQNCIATVGDVEHVRVLADAGWRGDVSVKLESSMHRYGATADDLGAVLHTAHAAGMAVDSFSLHLPLVGDAYREDDAIAEIEAWLAVTDPSIPMSVSHLDAESFVVLSARHRDRVLRLRCGTALWHGDKSFLHLAADVIDVRRVLSATTAGYRQTEVPGEGWLVMAGAGSAHGVAAHLDGRSPFHHARRRLALLEPPHMHTSMLFVPADDPCPRPGDWIDVQRPLTVTTVDEIVWLP